MCALHLRPRLPRPDQLVQAHRRVQAAEAAAQDAHPGPRLSSQPCRCQVLSVWRVCDLAMSAVKLVQQHGTTSQHSATGDQQLGERAHRRPSKPTPNSPRQPLQRRPHCQRRLAPRLITSGHIVSAGLLSIDRAIAGKAEGRRPHVRLAACHNHSQQHAAWMPTAGCCVIACCRHIWLRG